MANYFYDYGLASFISIYNHNRLTKIQTGESHDAFAQKTGA